MNRTPTLITQQCSDTFLIFLPEKLWPFISKDNIILILNTTDLSIINNW